MSPAGICNCGSPRDEHTPAEQAGCDLAFAELRKLREASDDAPPELVITPGDPRLAAPPPTGMTWMRLLYLEMQIAEGR